MKGVSKVPKVAGGVCLLQVSYLRIGRKYAVDLSPPWSLFRTEDFVFCILYCMEHCPLCTKLGSRTFSQNFDGLPICTRHATCPMKKTSIKHRSRRQPTGETSPLPCNNTTQDNTDSIKDRNHVPNERMIEITQSCWLCSHQQKEYIRRRVVSMGDQNKKSITTSDPMRDVRGEKNAPLPLWLCLPTSSRRSEVYPSPCCHRLYLWR